MTAVESHPASPAAPPTTKTAYLVVDTESVPDGDLIARVKYPGQTLTPDEAIDRAAAEARAVSPTGSDFLPVTFQTPVAYFSGTQPIYVAVGDFNGDGIPDLAVVNRGDNSISILLGVGDGAFVRLQVFAAVARFLLHHHLGAQGINARVVRDFIFVMVRCQRTKDQPDGRHVL